MKKIISIMLCVVLASVCFAGCKTDKNLIRLNEVTHSIFYAPLYLAMNLGFMEEEGMKINLTSGGGSDGSMAALLSGNSDMALLGPETVVYVTSQGSTNHPMIFGQLTKRDGSFLVSRTNETNFDWSKLENKYVIGGRRGGLPAMTLEYIVNSRGLKNGTNITLNLDLAFDMVVPTFKSGTGDYCTMFEPTASDYQAKGNGYIVASLGEVSGEIPYTCFMASPKFLNNNPDKIKGFLRAIKKAYAYIQTHSSEEVANGLKASFSTTSLELIISSVNSYKRIDAWMSSPAMTEASFNRLLEVIKNSGTTVTNVDFLDVVTYSIA
ncbi:MAG: ABC transporter substrate-binding protein [Clostridia bacterium]